MSVYYEITPVDTLFFRGSEPLEAGQLVNSGLFPPPVTVISGAFRSAVLKQQNISFSAYNDNSAPEEIVKLIGKSGEEAPFAVSAVLLKKEGEIYAPAPYSWFVNTDGKKMETGRDYAGLKVIRAAEINPGTVTQLGIASSVSVLPVVAAENEAVSLGGTWMKIQLLENGGQIVLSEDDILTDSQLYATESRTGISLLDSETGRPTRNVQKGALFTAAHIRLKDGVTMVVGISDDCGLAESGFLPLGGEQRRCGYEKTDIALPSGESPFYLAMAPVQAENEVVDEIFCAGKTMVTAGWDLHKKFHKPSRTWLPAGSVFKKNMNEQFIPIA